MLGVLGGYGTYFRILQTPLTETIDASYGRLPATPRPWLAALPRPAGPLNIALGLAAVLAITTAGLAIVLLARPQSAGADLSHGLAVGLVAAYVSSLCGGVWALAGYQIKNTLIWLDLSSDFFIVPRDFLSVRAGLTQSVYPDAHALLSQGGLFLLLRFCSSAQSHSSIRGGWTNTPRHDRYDGGSI